MDFRMQPFGSQEVSHAEIRKLLPVFAYHRNMRLSVFAFALALAAASEPSEELRKAVRGGDIAHARELLEQGVAVNGANTLGATPLHDAVWSGDAGMVALLLSFNADVNARHAEAGSTPLHYAIIANRVKIAEMLIDKAADVHARYRGGSTALHLAANRGSRAMLELLLAHGAGI